MRGGSGGEGRARVRPVFSPDRQAEGRVQGPDLPRTSRGTFRKHQLHFQGNFPAAESAATAPPALPRSENVWVFLFAWLFWGFVCLVFNSFLYFLCRKRKETKEKCGGKEDAGGQLFSKITRLESVFRSGTGAQGEWALLLNPKHTVKTGVSAQSKGRTRAGPEEKPSYWKRCS